MHDLRRELQEVDDSLAKESHARRQLTFEGIQQLATKRQRRQNAIVATATACTLLVGGLAFQLRGAGENEAVATVGSELPDSTRVFNQEDLETLDQLLVELDSLEEKSQRLRASTSDVLRRSRELRRSIVSDKPFESVSAMAVASASYQLKSGDNSSGVRKQLKFVCNEYPDTLGARRAKELLAELSGQEQTESIPTGA